MRFRDIAECACGTQITAGVTRCVAKDIVRHGDEGIFFAEHLTVLANNSQSVHVRIDHEAHVRFALTQQVADFCQVLRQRFGIMRKTACRLAVKFDDIIYAQGLEHSRNSQSANGVDAVDGNGEVLCFNRFRMHQVEVQYLLNMIGQVVLVSHVSKVIHFGEGEVLALGDSEHTFSLRIVEEFSVLIEQFEGVPLLGIMAGGEDDTSCCFLACDCQFGSRSGGKTDINYVVAHAHKRAANDLLDHVTTQTCVATNDDGVVIG